MCATCGGARYVLLKLLTVDPVDGRASDSEYRACPACAADTRTTEQKMAAMGFNWVKTFGDWQPADKLTEAYKTCMELLDGLRWVVFLRGGVGCGKTHLAVATTYEFVAAGKTAVMWNVPDLLDAIRACYDRGNEQAQYDFLHAQIYNRDVVVLDDLGANKPTAWSNAMLYEIVDKLYRERATKKLIVTTNVRPGRENVVVGDERVIDARLLSRIRPGEAVIEGVADRRPEFDR